MMDPEKVRQPPALRGSTGIVRTGLDPVLAIGIDEGGLAVERVEDVGQKRVVVGRRVFGVDWDRRRPLRVEGAKVSGKSQTNPLGLVVLDETDLPWLGGPQPASRRRRVTKRRGETDTSDRLAALVSETVHQAPQMGPALVAQE
jgi:hypothetical protein